MDSLQIGKIPAAATTTAVWSHDSADANCLEHRGPDRRFAIRRGPWPVILHRGRGVHVEPVDQ
eukprot:10792220-Alexandrium_andersonii.AAC.1